MITIYQNFYTMQPHYLNIDSVLNRIMVGKSAEMVAKCRDSYGDKKLYDSLKKKLPSIMFCGQFGKREIKGLVMHSGFICLDFDKFPDLDTLTTWKESLQTDDYTYSIFTSPSGYGLKCIVRIPQPIPFNNTYVIHKAYFRGLQAYYDCPYFDPNMFDVSRICFESHDPELIINHDSLVWDTLVYDPPPAIIEYNKASLDEQETARRLLVWHGRKYGMNSGNRNSNLFRLCAAFNDYGISLDYAFALCSQYQADDFKLSEIETTVKSAYKKTLKHGSLKF